jgi:hypothetical protein
LVRPLGEIGDLAKSVVDEAAPIRGALCVIYFDFFFFFFFFIAMILSSVLVMNLRQGWFSRRLNLGPWALAPLPSESMPQGDAVCNRKAKIILIFP